MYSTLRVYLRKFSGSNHKNILSSVGILISEKQEKMYRLGAGAPTSMLLAGCHFDSFSGTILSDDSVN